jgi:epoxyqueuosine reductase
MQREWVVSAEGWAGAHTALACALSCARSGPDDLSGPGDPHALVAPFARGNYYAAAVRMMQGLLRRIGAEAGFSPRACRIFANSPIPEKPFLVAAGIGTYGKHSLTIIPGLGSMFVIAGCILPLAAGASEPGPGCSSAAAPSDCFPVCGSCTRCMDACPVSAIVEPGVVDPGRCLQGLAELPIALAPAVMERWGRRLYGCQDCQEACPHNTGLPASVVECPGDVGPSVSIRRVLEAGTAGVREMFRGTPMGVRRIHPAALLRNALVAAGNSGEASLRGLVEGFLADPEPILRETVRWALGRLGP